MTNDYVKRIKGVLPSYRDEKNALPMKKYMKDHFEFLGIRSPELKIIAKDFMKESGFPEDSAFHQTVRDLWILPEREYQYFAIKLLDKKKKNLTREDITFLEDLITNKSWWDTIDYIAPNLIGTLFSRCPEMINDYTVKWIASDNIWLQRTAILFQLKYKEKTDTDLLFQTIIALAESKEFFIRKAIGWALREYSKTDAEAVIQFVNKHSLSPLSEREALKVIKREKMRV